MPREREATLHAVVVWPFAEAVRRLGFPLPEMPELLTTVLRELTGEAVPDTERITHEHARLLLEWVVKITGRSDLGLLAAEAVEPGHFELVELASRAQSTVGEGLQTLASLLPILHDALRVKVTRAPGTSRVRLTFEGNLPLHPAGYDFILASLFIAARRQTRAPELRPVRVGVPYAARDDAGIDRLPTLIGCPIEHDCEALEIELATADLDRPLARADASIGHALREVGQGLLAKDDAPGKLEAEVRARVRDGLATNAVDAATLARALHMSERTLRRKLDAEGIGLRGLVDDVRRELALEKLKDDALSTEALAEQLGFTTAQAFHRAFRRWTGGTVQAYRTHSRP